MGLQEQLDTMRDQSRGTMSEETRGIMARALEQLEAGRLLQKALGPGARMPEFSLEDSAGRVLRSQELLQAGPLVINFYRGSW